MSERTERHAGMRHATAAGLPRGGPARLRQAARLASVRTAIGDALGRHLLGLREEPDGVVLLLGGDGWERGLASHLEALAGPVARALGGPPRPVTVESVPLEPRSGLPPPANGAVEAPGSIDPQERRRRLEAAAERLLARSPDRGRGGRSGEFR